MAWRLNGSWQFPWHPNQKEIHCFVSSLAELKDGKAESSFKLQVPNMQGGKELNT